MSGEIHTSPRLTPQQLEVLANISRVAIESGLAQKYSRALTVSAEYLKNSTSLLENSTDPSRPTNRHKRAVYGPQPISSPLETFFAASALYEHGDNNSNELKTSFFLIQIDSVCGDEIAGSSVCIGTLDHFTWTPRIDDKFTDIFTYEDLETVIDFVVLQERQGIRTEQTT